MNKRTLALSMAAMALVILLAGGMGTAAQPLPTQMTPAVPEEPLLESAPELTEPTGAEAALALATTRVSVSSAGVEGNNESNYPALSNDGRYVAFESLANNLVANDTNVDWDVFVHDRQTGQTERVSVSSSGLQGNGKSWSPAISSTGRYIAFSSFASNLVSGDTNNGSDIFVMDRDTGVIQRVSVSSSEAQTAGGSHDPAISSNGRYIAFYSGAGDLVASDTNDKFDVFVRDTVAGETWLVSVSTGGAQGNHDSWGKVSISGDGRRVGFASWASTLVSNDTNGVMDVFVRDWFSGLTTLASISSGGAFSNGNSSGMISSNGRYVAFGSDGSNLVSGDTNGVSDAFVHDLDTGLTERVTVSASGGQSNGGVYAVDISTGGRLVIFHSSANNLVSNDTNSRQDVFVYDRDYDRTSRVSIATNGTQGNANALYLFDMSGDTRFVAFSSYASNLVANDSNGVLDVFVREFKSCYALTLQKQSGQGDSPQASPAQSIGCEPGTYQPGEQITVMANEADGWHVAGWSGTNDDSSQSSTNIVTMPNSDHTVGVSYEANCYTLTLNVSPNNSGNVTPTPPKSASCPANLQYTTGASVSLRAMANTGYEFSGWSGALSGATNPQSLTMDGNKSVTANFVVACYTLTLNRLPSSGGSISASPLKSASCPTTYQYTAGTSVSLTATPNTGYQFDGWSGALSGTQNPQSIVINDNESVTARFGDSNDECFLLILDHTGNGSDPTTLSAQSTGCSAGFYRSGEEIELQAHPTNGSDVEGWSGTNNNSSTSPRNTVTMPAQQHTVVVHYRPNGSATGRAFLPSVVHVPSACWSGPDEIEPNNNAAQSNGPLCSGLSYMGRPDRYDVFFIDAAAGPISVTLSNHTGSGVQLQLHCEAITSAPCDIDYDGADGYRVGLANGATGRYYIVISTPAPGVSGTPYTLTPTFIMNQ